MVRVTFKAPGGRKFRKSFKSVSSARRAKQGLASVGIRSSGSTRRSSRYR